jgi:GH18 family chitinase
MNSFVRCFFLLIAVAIHFIHSQQFVIGCYFTNWSQYRQGPGYFIPSLCTHLYYAFANIDVKTRSPSPAEIKFVDIRWCNG